MIITDIYPIQITTISNVSIFEDRHPVTQQVGGHLEREGLPRPLFQPLASVEIAISTSGDLSGLGFRAEVQSLMS